MNRVVLTGTCHWDSSNMKRLEGFLANKSDLCLLITTLVLVTETISADQLTSLTHHDLSMNKHGPRQLYNCTGLTHHDLSMNKLAGDLPADIGGLRKNLMYLALNSNGFTSEIPSDVG
jgi:hypothetical protein